MATSLNPIAAGWLNENSLRDYPIHEGCGRRPYDSAGVVVNNGWAIPNCLLVDMSISVPRPESILYLGSMSVISRGVTLVFCDKDGNSVISLFASADNHVPNTSYQVSGTGSFLGARGIVCLGDLEAFFEQTPEGMYTFSIDETRIEPTCIRQSSVGVTSVQAIDTSGYAIRSLTGDVKLVAGRNIRFDYSSEDNALVISADPNSGYSENCECESSGDKVVRSINGIAIEDVEIVGDDGCVTVNKESGVIRISDSCSKPCCGCAETVFINQTINDLQTSVNTLEGNVSSLGDRLMTFVNSYVLSRKTLQ